MRADVPVTDDDVDVANAVVSIASAVVLALYTAWITADLLPRWVVVPVVTAAVGYALYTRPDDRSAAVYACYAAAVLVFVTPVFVALPDVLSADAYGASAWTFSVTIANAILVAVFAVTAAVLAYVGYRLDGGRGVVERARNR